MSDEMLDKYKPLIDHFIMELLVAIQSANQEQESVRLISLEQRIDALEEQYKGVKDGRALKQAFLRK